MLMEHGVAGDLPLWSEETKHFKLTVETDLSLRNRGTVNLIVIIAISLAERAGGERDLHLQKGLF